MHQKNGEATEDGDMQGNNNDEDHTDNAKVKTKKNTQTFKITTLKPKPVLKTQHRRFLQKKNILF